MTNPKPITEGHFGLVITSVHRHPLRFPRVNPDDLPLALMVSGRVSKPRRYNCFGGGRRGEPTGVCTLRRELAEEAGNDMTWELMGEVGVPLVADLPAKVDYAFPYLVIHTGGEPLPETAETADYVRLTADADVAKRHGMPGDPGKCRGAVRYYGDLPYVAGTKPELARTEKMIRYGLTLCEIPEVIPTAEWMACGAAEVHTTKQASGCVHVFDEFETMVLHTPGTVYLWKMVPAQPLIDARAHPDYA